MALFIRPFWILLCIFWLNSVVFWRNSWFLFYFLKPEIASKHNWIELEDWKQYSKRSDEQRHLAAAFGNFRRSRGRFWELTGPNKYQEDHEYRRTMSTTSTTSTGVPQEQEYHNYHKYHEYRSTTSTTSTKSTGEPRAGCFRFALLSQKNKCIAVRIPTGCI